MTKSELFKAAHKMVRDCFAKYGGADYQATLAAALSLLYKVTDMKFKVSINSEIATGAMKTYRVSVTDRDGNSEHTDMYVANERASMSKTGLSIDSTSVPVDLTLLHAFAKLQNAKVIQRSLTGLSGTVELS